MRTLVLALAMILACSALMAQSYPVVDVFLDITDPDNVILTALNENGTYGGAYFGIDGLQVFGDVYEYVPGPVPYWVDVISDWGFDVTMADGYKLLMYASDPVWLEYGVSYNLGGIVNSSNPADFSALEDGSDTGYFLIVDVGDPSNPNGWNGLGDGSGKLLGQIIPEPATLVMLAIGATAVIRRRR